MKVEETSASRTDNRGVVEVLDRAAYGPIVATCGTCGRSWDDAVVTGWTPAPMARCPFEDEHADEDRGPPTFDPATLLIDGELTCPHCAGQRFRYRELVDEYREVDWRRPPYTDADAEMTVVLSYTGEHGDGDSDGVIYCSGCLAEWGLPDEFEWD